MDLKFHKTFFNVLNIISISISLHQHEPNVHTFTQTRDPSILIWKMKKKPSRVLRPFRGEEGGLQRKINDFPVDILLQPL